MSGDEPGNEQRKDRKCGRLKEEPGIFYSRIERKTSFKRYFLSRFAFLSEVLPKGMICDPILTVFFQDHGKVESESSGLLFWNFDFLKFIIVGVPIDLDELHPKPMI